MNSFLIFSLLRREEPIGKEIGEGTLWLITVGQGFLTFVGIWAADRLKERRQNKKDNKTEPKDKEPKN